MRMKKVRNEAVALVLEDGEHVHEGIMEACREEAVDSAMVLSGIGMVRNAKIGFWNGSDYVTEIYSGPVELVSLGGSVAMMDGQLSVHLHMSVAGEDHGIKGGHLVSADVHNINEIALYPFPAGVFRRQYSMATKLNMLYFTPPEVRK